MKLVISLNDCVDRNTFRNNIQNLDALCGEKTRKGWTVERKAAHSVQMRAFWQEKKRK